MNVLTITLEIASDTPWTESKAQVMKDRLEDFVVLKTEKEVINITSDIPEEKQS